MHIGWGRSGGLSVGRDGRQLFYHSSRAPSVRSCVSRVAVFLKTAGSELDDSTNENVCEYCIDRPMKRVDRFRVTNCSFFHFFRHCFRASQRDAERAQCTRSSSASKNSVNRAKIRFGSWICSVRSDDVRANWRPELALNSNRRKPHCTSRRTNELETQRIAADHIKSRWVRQKTVRKYDCYRARRREIKRISNKNSSERRKLARRKPTMIKTWFNIIAHHIQCINVVSAHVGTLTSKENMNQR